MINIGPVNIIQLLLNLIDLLVRKGLVSVQEADNLLKKSMDSNMSDNEKDEALKKFKGN